MKMNGVEVKGLNEIQIVIPRGNDIANAIVFTARALESYKEFNILCPEPKAKVKLMPGGKRVADDKTAGYLERRAEYETRRMAWIIITSLRATPGLEWETVDYEKPETWPKFEDELKAAGFTPAEIHKIIGDSLEVNALSDEKLDRARAQFLSFQQEQAEKLSSQEEDQASTESGEPANASA